MSPITTSATIGWLDLDAWAGSYVAARWLTYEELPQKQWQAVPRHGPLSQLVLVAAHGLVEQMFFRCVGQVLEANPGKHPKIAKEFEKKAFKDAFVTWPASLGLAPFNLNSEPFRSTERLRDRRNKTVHSEAALASLEMARSALFSAVEGSKAIAIHMLGPAGWKYDPVLAKYPLQPERSLSEVTFVERFKARP